MVSSDHQKECYCTVLMDYSKDANVVEIFSSYKESKPLFQGTSEVELKQELDSATSDNRF